MASSYRDILEDDHLEQDSIVTCRICFQCDGEEGDEDLISPCMCKGTHQFVHRSCLDRWRSVKKGFHFLHCTTCKAQFHLRVKGNVWRKTKAGLFVAGDVVYLFSALQLVIGMLGGLAYLLGIHGYLKDSLINNHWDQILSRHPIPIYYGIGVFAFFTLLVMLVLIVLQCWFIKDDMLQFHIEPNDYPMSNTIDMDFVLARCFLSFVIYGIVSIMAVLLVATAGLPFYILTSWRQHNRIDTKKEHTKEYIVEDLHGCYTPAKLDPEHLKRLKTLKLL